LEPLIVPGLKVVPEQQVDSRRGILNWRRINFYCAGLDCGLNARIAQHHNRRSGCLKKRVGVLTRYPTPKSTGNRLPGQLDHQFCRLILDHVGENFSVHFFRPGLRFTIEAYIAAINDEGISSTELHVVFR